MWLHTVLLASWMLWFKNAVVCPNWQLLILWLCQTKLFQIDILEDLLNVAKCNLGQVKRETMLASGHSSGFGVGWPGVLRRGLSVVYSSASDVNSFRVYFRSRIAPPCSRALHSPSTLEGREWWLPLTGLSWIPFVFGYEWLMAPPSLFQAPFPKLIYCDEFKCG